LPAWISIFRLPGAFGMKNLRADRQPEHTQIDMEMSFVSPEDIFMVVEDMIRRIFGEFVGVDVQLPLLRMPYPEAMLRYGSDKPDLRFGLEIRELNKIFAG